MDRLKCKFEPFKLKSKHARNIWKMRIKNQNIAKISSLFSQKKLVPFMEHHLPNLKTRYIMKKTNMKGYEPGKKESCARIERGKERKEEEDAIEAKKVTGSCHTSCTSTVSNTLSEMLRSTTSQSSILPTEVKGISSVPSKANDDSVSKGSSPGQVRAGAAISSS
ncbi:hypothetical protein MTR_4g109210 [Medicago truncatula]|uniref:Uncharacterized protein n=1 Tax=Medicago truncatula TaxID=3880 RepID=A0A072V1I8_MEDTR|nr:hypothetical protein MTR_4g109210 [Medicago truncatula]